MRPLGDATLRALALVRDEPGRSTSDLARALGMDASSADYHLRRLERERLLHGRPWGRERVWFPPQVACPLLRAHWGALAKARGAAEALVAGAGSVREVGERAGLRPRPARDRLGALVAARLAHRPDARLYVAAQELPRCLAAMDDGGRCPWWGRCGLTASPGSSAPGCAAGRSDGQRRAP